MRTFAREGLLGRCPPNSDPYWGLAPKPPEFFGKMNAGAAHERA